MQLRTSVSPDRYAARNASVPGDRSMTKWTLDAAHANVEFSVKHMMITTIRGRFRGARGRRRLRRGDTRALVRLGPHRDREHHDEPGTPRRPPPQPRLLRRRAVPADPLHQHPHRARSASAPQGPRRPDDQGPDPSGRPRRRAARHGHRRCRAAGVTAVSADTKISRKDWGLTWNVALESGGWLVGDEIGIHLEFELMAPAAELAAELRRDRLTPGGAAAAQTTDAPAPTSGASPCQARSGALPPPISRPAGSR